MAYISSFYNRKKKRSETIISGRATEPTEEIEIVNYINKYCPVEDRTVDGVDSLNIRLIDNAGLVKLLTEGHAPNRIEGIAVLKADKDGNITDYRPRW